MNFATTVTDTVVTIEPRKSYDQAQVFTFPVRLVAEAFVADLKALAEKEMTGDGWTSNAVDTFMSRVTISTYTRTFYPEFDTALVAQVFEDSSF